MKASSQIVHTGTKEQPIQEVNPFTSGKHTGITKKSTVSMKQTSVMGNGPIEQPRFLTIVSRSLTKKIYGP